MEPYDQGPLALHAADRRRFGSADSGCQLHRRHRRQDRSPRPHRRYLHGQRLADSSVPIEQVLAIVDFGLTASDIVGVNSYPMPPMYPSSPTRVTYMFRLTVAATKMKETIDKLEKLRKGTDTGIDLSYSTTGFGPTQAATDDAHEKALPDLMASARKQAQSLATAAQLKLGAIQGVTEAYSYPPSHPGPVQPMVTFSAVVRFAAQ